MQLIEVNQIFVFRAAVLSFTLMDLKRTRKVFCVLLIFKLENCRPNVLSQAEVEIIPWVSINDDGEKRFDFKNRLAKWRGHVIFVFMPKLFKGVHQMARFFFMANGYLSVASFIISFGTNQMKRNNEMERRNAVALKRGTHTGPSKRSWR